MAQLKAILTNAEQTFPGGSAPVPHQYRFELSGPANEEKMVPYTGTPTVEVLFSPEVTPGTYAAEVELLDMAGARIGDLKTAVHTVAPPQSGEIKIKVSYPAGKGIVIESVEV